MEMMESSSIPTPSSRCTFSKGVVMISKNNTYGGGSSGGGAGLRYQQLSVCILQATTLYDCVNEDHARPYLIPILLKICR